MRGTDFQRSMFEKIAAQHIAKFYQRNEFDVLTPQAEQEGIRDAMMRAARAVKALDASVDPLLNAPEDSFVVYRFDTDSVREFRALAKTLYAEGYEGPQNIQSVVNQMLWQTQEMEQRAELIAQLEQTVEEVREMEQKVWRQKNLAYSERNKVLAAFAKAAIQLGWNVGVGKHPAEDVLWEDDWRDILFIEFPTGQASWHFHTTEAHLLDGLPIYTGKWDGHSTEDKYKRIEDYRTYANVPPHAHANVSQGVWQRRLDASARAQKSFDVLLAAREPTWLKTGDGMEYRLRGMLFSAFTGEPMLVLAPLDPSLNIQVIGLKNLPPPLEWASEEVRLAAEKHDSLQY